jgi:cell division protein FtsW
MRRAIGEYRAYFHANRLALLPPLCVGFLNVAGLLTLSSASLSFVGANYLLRQCLWLFLALPSCLIALLLPLDRLPRRGRHCYALALLLLALVLVPGIGLSINGSRRWFELGFCHLQASEFAKIALIIFLAADLSRQRPGDYWTGFFRPCLHLLLFSALLLAEPDYGSTLLFLAVGMGLLFLNGAPLRLLLGSALCAAALFALFVALNPIRLGRILAFLDIESTRQSGSYQLWQSLVGFNSGGWHGLGLGNGRQQFFYLPEAHTDFIFPVLAEEWGFPFSALVLLAYFSIFAIAWWEIYRIRTPFLFLLSSGALLLLLFQEIINLAVVMGLFPTKGMPLPWISYGGSNLISIYFLLGLLLNCFRTAFFEDSSSAIQEVNSPKRGL